MITKLTLRAKKKGSYFIDLDFTDENGDGVIPKTLTWTFSNLAGVTVNERSQVSVTPAASVTIALSGADLALQAGESVQFSRLFTIEGTYDSDEGSDLPFKDACEFTIDDLVAVAN